MPKFSQKSLDRLNQCDERLIKVFSEVILTFDCSVLCGYRNEEDQNEAFNSNPKRSGKTFPHSKHNTLPSMAVDVAPYPIDWENLDRFRFFVGYVLGTATEMGIKLRSGLDWDGDTDLNDQSLIDMPHYEVIS